MISPSPVPGNGPIGVFGGTFDPIHFGHLRTALELSETLGLAEVRFIPCSEPPHRDRKPTAGNLRLEMIKTATAEHQGFVVDDREFRRSGPSYTIDTLSSLKDDFPETPLCLLLGMDAFLGLSGWHRWTELFELAHLVVAQRPGWNMPEDSLLGRLLEERRTAEPARLHETPSGHIFLQAVTQLEISATELRHTIAAGVDPRYLLPDSVRAIILDSGCYR
ncbi:MAG TPA: nicotinate-nucleotide adenylyltransferase [Gammaproteobacteria bacterium]